MRSGKAIADDSGWVEPISCKCCPTHSTGESCVCGDAGYHVQPILSSRWTLRPSSVQARVSGHRLITNWYRVSTCWPNDQIGLWNLIWVWWGGEEEGVVLVSAIRREIVFLFSILFVAPLKLTAHGVANHIADKLGRRMFVRCRRPWK